MPDAEPIRRDSDADGHTVLVIDDDPAMRAALRHLLELDGCGVVEAGNGDEAMERLSGGVVDLVLTDLEMPGMSGESLAARIREVVGPGTPIVAVSRRSPSADARDLFDAALRKPVSGADLQPWIHG